MCEVNRQSSKQASGSGSNAKQQREGFDIRQGQLQVTPINSQSPKLAFGYISHPPLSYYKQEGEW